MPTLRPWTALLLGAMLSVGCADANADDRAAAAEGELREDEPLNPLDEEGVLLLANDRAVTVETLTTRASLGADLAKAIVDYRTDADGKPRWFRTIDEVTSLPGLGMTALDALIVDARANGYAEASGFEPPSAARIVVRPGVPRPTSNDVTVEAGFDGKTPDEVVALVRGRITNAVYAQNERFLADTVRETHKAFTIGLGNFFAANSPFVAFVNGLQADRITFAGTMRMSMPTLLLVEKAGVTTYYARGDGGYQAIPKPNAPIVMRARVRTGNHPDAQGVRLFYPAWSAKVLSGPTAEITEGG